MQGGCVGDVGRCYKKDPLNPVREVCKRGCDQLHLANTTARCQQFGQGSAGPATLMQRRIERRVPAWQAVVWLVGGRMASGLPDVGAGEDAEQGIGHTH